MAPWFVYATCASILWGLSYALSGWLMKQGATPPFLLVFNTLITAPIYIFIAWKTSSFVKGGQLIAANPTILWVILLSCLAMIAGNFLIMTAISEKNATLASLVEISYPLFTFLFAWLLFRDVQLTATTAAGGLLILCGAALISWKA